jgi:hypothetical protein
MTFNKWLRAHKDDNTPIGDLARDYITDCRERGIRAMDHEELEDSLRKHRADRDCWNTFEEAVEEWKTFNSSKA